MTAWAMSEIQKLMIEITNLDEIQVYSVNLMRFDHTTKWHAHAVIRADSRNVSVEHDEPVDALRELKKLILSLVCPHCHRLMDDPARKE